MVGCLGLFGNIHIARWLVRERAVGERRPLSHGVAQEPTSFCLQNANELNGLELGVVLGRLIGGERALRALVGEFIETRLDGRIGLQVHQPLRLFTAHRLGHRFEYPVQNRRIGAFECSFCSKCQSISDLAPDRRQVSLVLNPRRPPHIVQSVRHLLRAILMDRSIA